MESATIKDLRKYLKPGIGWLVGAIICLVMGVFYLAGLPFMTVFMVVAAALCFWRRAVAVKKLDAQMELDAGAELVLRDFAGAKPVFGDSLRVGNFYLYGKKQGRLVRYGDIKQVYQHIQKTYFVETERTLIYVNQEGKKRTLCSLPIRDKGKEELVQVVGFMLSKNPNIKVGYK